MFLSTAHLLLPTGMKLGLYWVVHFIVLARVGKVAYRLELPVQITINPIFYISLLKPYDTSGDLCYRPPPVPVLVTGQQE